MENQKIKRSQKEMAYQDLKKLPGIFKELFEMAKNSGEMKIEMESETQAKRLRLGLNNFRKKFGETSYENEWVFGFIIRKEGQTIIIKDRNLDFLAGAKMNETLQKAMENYNKNKESTEKNDQEKMASMMQALENVKEENIKKIPDVTDIFRKEKT